MASDIILSYVEIQNVDIRRLTFECLETQWQERRNRGKG